ncbi:MAG: hypothetical protein HW416_1190 [Chloroflexi bacterium]|nr:hypothetical protein [Chloroflexota bacterium]
MVQEEMRTEEEASGLPAGAIIGTAITAGVIAFLIRRALRTEPPRVQTPGDMASAAFEQVSDPDFRSRTAAATREFMLDRVVPEIKPVMLDMLRAAKDYVDQGFKRAEKAIKEL